MTPESERSSRDRRQVGIRRLLLAIIALFVAADFLFGYSIERPRADRVLIVCFGAVGAQGVFHAIWCVLAPVQPATRLGVGIAAALGGFGGWALGLASYYSSRPYWNADYGRIVVVGLLCLPLVLVAFQLPLWFARGYFRWRILHRRDPARRLPVESIGIRDILLATGVVALVLSAARVGVTMTDAAGNSALIRLVIGAMVAAAISLFTTPPVIVATLRARRVWAGMAAVLFLDLTVMFAFFAAIWVATGRWPPHYLCLRMVITAVAFAVCTTGPLLLMRRRGYRLYWGRRVAAVREKGTGPGVATPGLGGCSGATTRRSAQNGCCHRFVAALCSSAARPVLLRSPHSWKHLPGQSGP